MEFILAFVELDAINARMFARSAFSLVQDRLAQFPAVALLGPRQVGKTTLAEQVGSAFGKKALYLDLEALEDRKKLTDPTAYFSAHSDALIILDEVQRAPELFQTLRGVIDRNRKKGRDAGQFLLLGSASMALLQQSSESLAGRIAYVELPGFSVLEILEQDPQLLWLRGGFPKSFLAGDDRRSMVWRQEFVRTYLERDIPQFGFHIPAETLRRFWTMLAHLQGAPLNAANLARSLAVDGKTIARYLDLMVDLLLVRRLKPYHANIGKRLVRAPKIYVRDSGLVHFLLSIPDTETLLGHPIVGNSWEGWVMENLLNALPQHVPAYFYRTATGVEMDLVLEVGRDIWAIEIKRSVAPSLGKGFHQACDDLRPRRVFVVCSGQERYPIGKNQEVIGVTEMARCLSVL